MVILKNEQGSVTSATMHLGDKRQNITIGWDTQYWRGEAQNARHHPLNTSLRLTIWECTLFDFKLTETIVIVSLAKIRPLGQQ